MPPHKQLARKEPFEHEEQKDIPPPPVHVAKARFPVLTLASRSPLSVVFGYIKPSWRYYIQYVDLAARRGDQAMAHYRDVYNSLSPREQASVWPEQLCDKAQVLPGELVAAVCRACWENSAAESSMITSSVLPQVLLYTAKLAQKPENFRDREMILRASGMLPDKHGTSINIVNNPLGTQEAPSLPELATGRKLGTFDQEIIEMSRDLETPFLVKGTDVSPESD